MEIVLYLISFLIVATCTLQGIANAMCNQHEYPIIHTVEKITAYLFDAFLLVDCVIISVAIVMIWRARLFADLRNMSAKRSMLIIHILLLVMIIAGRVIYAVG